MKVKNKCNDCGKSQKLYINSMKAARKIKRNYKENDSTCNVCKFRELARKNIRGGL